MSYLLRASSVNIARAIYALNWFDIAPGLIYISNDMNLKVVQLGVIATAFYIGLAGFQMVGGALASRIGSKKVAFMGLVVAGLGCVFSGLSYNLSELILARFATGVGSAMFFSPGLSILRDVSPPGSYGVQVGIYNGAFYLGGGIGAFGWVFVDKLVGWRASLILGGVLAIGIAIENFVVLREVKEEKSQQDGFIKKLYEIVRNKFLWLLALGSTVGIFTETIIGQFLIFFGENYLGLAASLSGLLDGVFLVVGFIGGIAGGHLISKSKSQVVFTYTVLLLSGFVFLFIPFTANFFILLAIVIILGFVSVSVFSVLYVTATHFVKDNSLVPFSLSFVNFIQLAVGAISPVIFTFATYHIGYQFGFIVVGILGLAMIPLMLPTNRMLRSVYRSS